MVFEDRINVIQRTGAEDWDEAEIKTTNRVVSCTYQIKQQITIKLGAPYNDTITIETNEPISDRGDIEQFAREILSAAELRHESNRKQTIVKHRKEFHSAILPLWFEREAYKARARAEEQDMRKVAKRDLKAGKTELKEYNDLIRALNSGIMDDDYIDDLKDYNCHLQQELCEMGASKNFHFSHLDIKQMLGRNIWEKSLQIREYCGKELDTRLLHIVARHLESFNRLYNIDHQHISLKYMHDNYDSITTAGFGNIILAAVLRKEGEICAVMAINDNQGRRALCHLVGEERLNEILPKRVSNAIIREGDISLESVERTDTCSRETIIITH